MKNQRVIFLSIPGLRPGDVTKQQTPALYEWANQGALAELTPTFPCVTSPVQATTWTGLSPGQHGVIANGFYHRDRKEVEFWVAPNDVIAGEQVWEALRNRNPNATSAVWHAQNIKGAAADYIVTPAPIHEANGSTKLWCYSKPDGLYPQLLDDLGHFPLQHYWGPLAGIESTRWILQGAQWLIARHNPQLHWIYLPHLDYASQKHGPNSSQALTALAELDTLLASFQQSLEQQGDAGESVIVVAGEYAMTDVSQVIYPNRVLRQAGLLTTQERDGAEHLDLGQSRAFAMVDHQFAHLYCVDADATARCDELFRGLPGLSGAWSGRRRRDIGMDHERCGDVVLIADDDAWLAYYWWADDAAAPAFARTVDIHRKPGYDPVELFFDPATKAIPLDATLVKGSHGVPATEDRHRTALICSRPSSAVESGGRYRDTDIKRIVLELLGV